MNLHFHSAETDDLKFIEAMSQTPTDLKIFRHSSIDQAIEAHVKDRSIGEINTVLLGISTLKDVEKLKLHAKKFDTNRFHAIASVTDADLLDALLGAEAVGNLVVRRFGDYPECAKHYARIIRSCDPSISGGVDLILGTGQMVSMDLVDESEKAAIEEAIIKELENLGIGTRVASVVASALDEMLLNATIDAPRERSVDEASDPQTSYDSRVQIQLASDGEFVGINVVDYAGSLDRNAVFHHISKSFRSQTINDSKSTSGTMGLGLALIFRSGASIRFMCKDGQKTEVGLYFKLVQKIVEFRSQFQFISTQFWQ